MGLDNNSTEDLIRLKILTVLQQKGITEKELATILELPTSKTNQLLSGQKAFKISDVAMLCNYLEISLESIVSNK